MPSFLGATGSTQPVVAPVTFLPADTTVGKAVVGAQNGPWHLFDILVSSNDTAAMVVDIFVRSGSTSFLLGSMPIPAGSGVAGVKPVSFQDSVLPTGLVGLDFQGNFQLFAGMEATVTTAKTVTVTAFIGDY